MLNGWKDMWRGRNAWDVAKGLLTFGITDIAHIFKYLGSSDWDKLTQSKKQELVKELIRASIDLVLVGEYNTVEDAVSKAIAEVYPGSWDIWKNSNPTETNWIKEADKEVSQAYRMITDSANRGYDTVRGRINLASWKWVNKGKIHEVAQFGLAMENDVSFQDFQNDDPVSEVTTAGYDIVELIKNNMGIAAGIAGAGLLFFLFKPNLSK